MDEISKRVRRSYIREMILGGAIAVAGVALSAAALTHIAPRDWVVAQVTPPASPAPATIPGTTNAPSDVKPDETRPLERAPEPARPDADAQKAGATPALPPAPAEKMGEPIRR